MFKNELFMENMYGMNTMKNNQNEIQIPSALMPQTMMDESIKNYSMAYKGEKQPALFNPKEAYMKGNLFANLYDPYKNYKPAILTPKNEKERLFLDFSEVSFAAHELNLYLDIHPEDESMIALFNDYRKKANKLAEEYESKYGPLNITSDSLDTTPWMWTVQDFPWERSAQ